MAVIKGMPALLEKIDKIADGVDLMETLLQAGLVVERSAKEMCPTRDGILRNSITTQIVGPSSVEIGTPLEYAPYVEYGTGIYAGTDEKYGTQYLGTGRQTPWVYPVPEGYEYTDPKTGITKTAYFATTIGQKPQPFLEPALDNNRELIRQMFEDNLRRELE